jgi:hypothetical protein
VKGHAKVHMENILLRRIKIKLKYSNPITGLEMP